MQLSASFAPIRTTTHILALEALEGYGVAPCHGPDRDTCPRLRNTVPLISKGLRGCDKDRSKNDLQDCKTTRKVRAVRARARLRSQTNRSRLPRHSHAKASWGGHLP